MKFVISMLGLKYMDRTYCRYFSVCSHNSMETSHCVAVKHFLPFAWIQYFECIVSIVIYNFVHPNAPDAEDQPRILRKGLWKSVRGMHVLNFYSILLLVPICVKCPAENNANVISRVRSGSRTPGLLPERDINRLRHVRRPILTATLQTALIIVGYRTQYAQNPSLLLFLLPRIFLKIIRYIEQELVFSVLDRVSQSFLPLHRSITSL